MGIGCKVLGFVRGVSGREKTDPPVGAQLFAPALSWNMGSRFHLDMGSIALI